MSKLIIGIVITVVILLFLVTGIVIYAVKSKKDEQEAAAKVVARGNNNETTTPPPFKPPSDSDVFDGDKEDGINYTTLPPVRKSKAAYSLYEGIEMPGYDLQSRTDLADDFIALKEICDANPKCKGFTSAGYLKSEIIPTTFWVAIPSWKNVAGKGTYVKNS